MKLIFAAAFATVLVSSVVCDHWALLVAGSNRYVNYRHQADICHAYHIMHSHGIPDDRIVVMMYDDIAHNPQNPFPGSIINRPDGPNVYPGVPKDYTGHQVNSEVFLSVLTGDQEGVKKLTGKDGKVIKSGPNDNVFVYFADHGAPGLIAFPDSELHAEDLNKAILKMHQNNQYKQMVFYIEACESGSMFDHILRDDINVYATTAANTTESSFACYPDLKVRAYLGDTYSVKWMEDSDAENINTETLKGQYEIVKKETNTSHVQEYGDLSMGKEFVAQFQGNKSSHGFISGQDKKVRVEASLDAIPSEFVPIETLRWQVEASQGPDKVEAEREYRTLLKRNRETTKFFKRFVNGASKKKTYQQVLKTSLRFTDFKCYRQGIEMIKSACPGLYLTQNDFALRNLRTLANLCEADIPQDRIMVAIEIAADRSPIC